jgi:hypothetical protein
LLTGSLPGTVLVFRRKADGTLAAGEPLLGTDGKPLDPGSGTSVAVADLDGDGDPDLVVGVIDGEVKEYANDGKGRFAPGKAVTLDGVLVRAVDGGPELADWDGDGILDLLVGHEDGGVRLYKGTSKQGLRLGTMEYLVRPIRDSISFRPHEFADEARTTPAASRSVNRAKPYVTDWNGDGKRDLVVGDFLYVLPPMPKLAENQLDLLERLRSRSAQLDMQIGLLHEKIVRQEAAKLGADGWAGLKPAERAALDSGLTLLAQQDSGYGALVAANLENYNRFYALRGMPEYSGFVWVYIRK